MMDRNVKKRVFQIIQIGRKDDLPSRVFDIFISVVIIANIVTMFMETFDELGALMPMFHIVEGFTLAVFCVEYVLRIWTADLLYPKLTKKVSRLRFLVSFDGIVDLMTILPFFYLSGFIVFRMLRVVRIFHLFRINAQYDSFHVIVTVLKEKRNQIASSLFIIIVLMLASSLGIYSAEHKAQPEVFKNAFSGIWWSVSTLLTVGYGDIYPVTVVGRIMAIFIAFLGVGVVAIPTGIISAGFVEQYQKKQRSHSRFNDITHVGEILVDSQSELLGLTVSETETIYGMRVLVIVRNELAVIASANVKLKKNDILVVNSDKLKK